VTSTLLGLISGVMQNPLGTGTTDPKQTRGSAATDSIEDSQSFR
jgi:hypothetical protein